MKKQRHGYFPDDCWELIFHKLREDDERDLDSISLVSKRFLSISNRLKLTLNINPETLSLLSNLLRRFRHIKTIVMGTDIGKDDIDGALHQISRSGVLNLQAIKFNWCTKEPPRDGFKALALNKNRNNNLKVLDCSGLISIQDNDLVLIADCFPRLEKLRITMDTSKDDDVVAACITDDGVDALASKLKELEVIEFTANNLCVTDKGLISLSTNCVKLRKIVLIFRSSVTGDGIDFVMRHSPNLTSLVLYLESLQPSAFSFTIDNPFINAKNLRALTMSDQLISDKNIRLVAKARPPLKKLVLDYLLGLGQGQYPKIRGALQLLLQACQLTLEELSIKWLPHRDTDIRHLAKYLSNLTSIDLCGCSGLTSVTFYTLTKSCPSLEVLKMANTSGEEMHTFSPDLFPKNYRVRHLEISNNKWLNDTTLQNFGQVCPNLQFLRVSDCLRLTSFGIGEVLRRCPGITELYIFRLRVSDVFGKFSDHSIVNLKTLKAGGTDINDKGMTMIGNKCRNLEYLDISNCNKVTDKGVLKVVRNCKRLREVSLYGCEKVRANVLSQMVLSRPSLRSIYPPCCDDLSEQMRNIFLSVGCRLRVPFRLNFSSFFY